jgi:hypothetical protein
MIWFANSGEARAEQGRCSRGHCSNTVQHCPTKESCFSPGAGVAPPSFTTVHKSLSFHVRNNTRRNKRSGLSKFNMTCGSRQMDFFWGSENKFNTSDNIDF